MEETSKIPSISNKAQSQLSYSPQTNANQEGVENTYGSPTNYYSDAYELSYQYNNKLLLVNNFAPAHMINNYTKINRTLVYLGYKYLDWFSFVYECQGNISYVTKLAENIEISSGTLSNHKYQQYSIFEAEPASYSYANGFIQAKPSDQSKGAHCPILLQNHSTKQVYWAILLGLFSVVKIALFVTQFINKTRSFSNIQVFSLLSVVEAFVYMNYVYFKKSQHKEFTNKLQKDILEQSAELAVAVPRTLVSECGHAKYLKKQIHVYQWMYYCSLLLFGLTILFTSVCYSANNYYHINMYRIAGGLSMLQGVYLFYGLSIVTPTLLFCLMIVYQKNINNSLNLQRKSIIMNLRGFLLNNNYALDYSDIHQINEGLCYMYKSAPTVYFPYIAIKDVFVHFEPYRVKLQYVFTNQELLQLDAKNNIRARDILKRGYDQLIYDDILVWVIFQLYNDVKLWLPLSPTQLYFDHFSDTSIFGFTGCEISTVIQMIISQLMNQVDDEEYLEKLEKKFQSIAQFCYQYQQMRVEYVVEESLHIKKLDKIFIPFVDE